MPNKSPEELTAQIREIHKIRAEKKKTGIYFSVIVVLLLSGFGFHLKGLLAKNLAKQELDRAIQSRLSGDQPRLSHYINQLTQGVPDAFTLAFSNEVKARAPQLIGKTFGSAEEIKQKFGEQFHRSWQLKAVENKLALQMSGMGLDDAAVNDMHNHLKDQLNGIAEKQVSDAVALYGREVTDVKAILRAFPRDEQAKLSEKDAAKALIHNMLDLFDEEISKM